MYKIPANYAPKRKTKCKTLFDKLSDIFKSKELKDKTIQFYLNCLTHINEQVKLPPNTFVPTKYEDNLPILVHYFSVKTHLRVNQLKAIIMFYNLLGLECPEEFVQLLKRHMTQVNTIKSNKPKRQIDFTREDLDKAWDYWSKNINSILETNKDVKADVMRFIAVALYTRMPPCRPSEYLSLKIIDGNGDVDGNYLNLKTGVMFYKDFKTSKKWGEVSIETPKEVLEAIKAYYPVFDEIDGYKYIFTTKNGIMKSSNFTPFFKGIKMMNGLTPNDIRNLYCSTIPANTSLEERAKIASIMKHALNNQMVIYSKYNKDAYPKGSGEDDGDGAEGWESDASSISLSDLA